MGQKCEGCGAQLPDGQPGASVTCAYCGTVGKLPAPTREDFARAFAERAAASRAAAPPPDYLRPSVPPPRSSTGGILIVLAVFAIIGTIIAVAVVGGRSRGGSLLASYTRMQDVAPEHGWQALDPAGLPSPFAALDPIALYPWALARAQEWAPDATLTNFSLRRIKLDGHADASASASVMSGPGVTFSFTSPARMQAAASMRQVSTQQVMTGVRIEIGGGVVQALADSDVDDDPLPPAFPQPACSLAQVLSTMRAAGLEMRPAYDLMSTHDGRLAHWVWWINQTDLDHTPRVFADDCSLQP